MYRGRKQFGAHKQTRAQNLAALKMLLCSARSLDSFTPAQLSSMYGVDARVAEYELTVARQNRARTTLEVGPQ